MLSYPFSRLVWARSHASGRMLRYQQDNANPLRLRFGVGTQSLFYLAGPDSRGGEIGFISKREPLQNHIVIHPPQVLAMIISPILSTMERWSQDVEVLPKFM